MFCSYVMFKKRNNESQYTLSDALVVDDMTLERSCLQVLHYIGTKAK